MRIVSYKDSELLRKMSLLRNKDENFLTTEKSITEREV